MDRGAWQATVHAVAESEITEYARVRACGHTRMRARARTHTHTHTHRYCTAIEVSYYSGYLTLYFLPQEDSLV